MTITGEVPRGESRAIAGGAFGPTEERGAA